MVVVTVIVVSIGLVVRCMDNTGILIDWHRSMTVRVVMVLEHITARIARMRPEQGNQPRKNSADQRQKDDCLNHLPR